MQVQIIIQPTKLQQGENQSKLTKKKKRQKETNSNIEKHEYTKNNSLHQINDFRTAKGN